MLVKKLVRGIVGVLRWSLLVDGVRYSEVRGLLLWLTRLWDPFHARLNIKHFLLLTGPNLLEVLDPLLSELTGFEKILSALELRVDVLAALHARR